MTPTAPILVVVAVLGLAVGSFLGVLAWRWPQRLSVVRPASRCPRCAVPLRWTDNVPVLGFLRRRGRCRACDAPISWRYPAVEILTAAAFTGAVVQFGLTGEAVRWSALAAMLIAAAEADRLFGVVPNRLVGWAAGTALALHALAGHPVLAHFAPTVVAVAGTLALRWVGFAVWGRAGMGMGDVKLAAVLALFLGWEALWAFYLAALLAGSFGAVGLATRCLRAGSALPFAPFLAAGVAVSLLVPPRALLELLLW